MPKVKLQAEKFLCHSLRGASVDGRYGVVTELISDLLRSEEKDFINEPVMMPVIMENTMIRLMPDLMDAHNIPAVAARPMVQESMQMTRILAQFHGAVNCAEPSPCGRWVAVLTDSMTVTLLPEALDYQLRCGMMLKWPNVGPCAANLHSVVCKRKPL